MKKYAILLVFITILLGCYSTTVVTPTVFPTGVTNTLTSINPTNQILATNTPLSTIYPAPTKVWASTQTLTITAHPPLIPTNPTIFQICPDLREVSLTDLGMGPEYRLVVIPPDVVYGAPIQSGIATISVDSPVPQVLENTIQTDEWFIDKYKTSPDGMWLTFHKFRDNEDQQVIWMSSIDGEQLQEIQTVERGTQIDWGSDHEIALVGVPAEFIADGDYLEQIMPISCYNIKTKKLGSLSPKPIGSIYDKYFSDGDSKNAIFFYYEHTGVGMYKNFILYNYTDNTSLYIYKWLLNEPKANFFNTVTWNTFTPEGDIGFTIATEQPYGIDLANNLSLDDISSLSIYNEVMQPITFPLDFNYLYFRQLGVTDLIYVEPHQDFFLTDETKFYIYDPSEKVLKDYCFNIDFGTSMSSSPDGQFVAFTIYEGDSHSRGNAIEAVIINTTTGYISRIPNVQAIGWGIVNSDQSP